MECTKVLQTNLPPISGTTMYKLYCKRGKKWTVLVKLKNFSLNVKGGKTVCLPVASGTQCSD